MSLYVIENIVANEISLTGEPINDGSILLKEKEEVEKTEKNTKEVMKINEEELRKSEDFEREELRKSVAALKAERDELLVKVQKSECAALMEDRFDNVIRISKSEGDLSEVLLFLKSNNSSLYQTAFKSLAAIERVLKSRYEVLDVPVENSESTDGPTNDIEAGLNAALQY